MKSKIYIILFALLAITVFASCNSEDKNEEKSAEMHDEHGEEGERGIVSLNEKQQKALGLQIGDFKMRNLTTVIKANGTLEVSPENMAGVSAIIGGNVKKIIVFQGDKVRKGQTLAILEHPNYIRLQEDFAMTANNLDFLKQEYDRQKKLFDNDAGAGKDYQKAKSDYKNAKVKYEGLKARLLLLGLSPKRVKEGKISNTINIVAPISGFINKVNIKVGIYVDDKTQLFEIADNSKIHADFMIYEKDIHLVKIGQEIHFTIANRIDKEFTAVIFAIEKEFDRNSRSVNIHAKIKGDINGTIPGMYVTGHLHTDKNYVKTLPNDAIVKEGVKSYIFIVDNDKKNAGNEKTISLKMTEIIVGQSDDDYTEIKLLEELPADTKIVLNKAYYLLSEMNKEELGDDD